MSDFKMEDMSQYRPVSLAPSHPFRIPSYASSASIASSAGSIRPLLDRPRRKGVPWTNDWTIWPSFFIAFVLLAAWIGAAVYFNHVELVLPLNYFNSWGGGIMANGNYNQIVQFLSGLAGSIITFGIGQGLKSVILHEALSPRGLSLYRLDGITKMVNLELQLKFRSTAIGAFIMWVLATQFGTATQGTFGTATMQTNFTNPIQIARITDNAEYTTSYWENSIPFVRPGDLDNVVSAAYYSLIEGENNQVDFTVDLVLQAAAPEDPLLVISPVSYIDYEGNSTWLNPIPADKLDLLMSNQGANIVFAISEGVLAENTTCAPITIDNVEASYSSATRLTTLTLPFPCGTAQKTYATRANPVVNTMDYYACISGDPIIYVFGPTKNNSGIQSAWECTISAQTALVYSKFNEFNMVAKPIGTPWGLVNVDNIGTLIQYMGGQYFNSFGIHGSPALSYALYSAATAGPNDTSLDMTAVVERTVQSLVQVALKKIGGVMVAWAEDGYAAGGHITTTACTGYYQTQVLSLYLSGSQVLWGILPALLLLILLVLVGLYIFQGHGRTDLTDPVHMALIGLGSPRDPRVHGGATGELEDEELYRHLRIYYGDDSGHPSNISDEGYGGHGSHLILSCDATGLARPTKLIKYS